MKITLLSKIFNPILRLLPSEEKYTSKSQRLFLYYGLISPSSFGNYTIMPILQRSLDKLKNIIHKEMACIDAQKLTMPSLGRSQIWKKSGRWSLMDNELYKVTDRNLNQFCLQPTHEEEVTSLLSTFKPLKVDEMPILFYQITQKFRNEAAPKSGLLRCREFLMKDLYSFDSNEDSAMQTYHKVLEQYHRVFEQLGLNFVCVGADCGDMGGKLSHEFHLESPVGEDVLLLCDKCKKGFNQELRGQSGDDSSQSCPDRSCAGTLSRHNAIEIGHCFLLGERYSKAFDLYYQDKIRGKKYVTMGCYGIGVTRLLAACVESLSKEDKIRWPYKLAPYRVAILLQKEGAHDQPSDELKRNIFDKLTKSFMDNAHCPSDILVDDSNFTIGKKLANCDSIGIPWAIVVKNKDLLETVDLYNAKSNNLPIDEAIARVSINNWVREPSSLKI